MDPKGKIMKPIYIYIYGPSQLNDLAAVQVATNLLGRLDNVAEFPLNQEGLLSAQTAAQSLADVEGGIALTRSTYYWLLYRHIEGASVMFTRRPVDGGHVVTIGVSNREAAHMVPTETLEEAQRVVDTLSTLFDGRVADEHRDLSWRSDHLQRPEPRELKGLERLPDGRHKGLIGTYWWNIWKGQDLVSSDPVQLVEVPDHLFTGTGTILTVQRVDKHGQCHKVEVALTTSRNVRHPEPGYTYCEFRYR